MKIKKYFLIFTFFAVSIIGLIYGAAPRWFALTFLGVAELDLDFVHILRAIMCLYLALGSFWLFAAFRDEHRNTAVLTTGIFAAGLVIGRLFSLFVDGKPSPLLVFYIFIEFALIPVAYWVFKLPD